MLYVFSGFPKTKLNAGGLQHAVEEVEELGLLEHDPAIQVRKEGVFVLSGPGDSQGEWLRPIDHKLSDRCTQAGITWDWFPEDFTFGNGVTVHKTIAYYETKTVIHGPNVTVDDLLQAGGTVDMGQFTLRQVGGYTESWREYEARWLPGTCPQAHHIVHLTWLVTLHHLPAFAYDRLRCLIEDPACQLENLTAYRDKHFSESRAWNGKPMFHKGGVDALPPVA